MYGSHSLGALNAENIHFLKVSACTFSGNKARYKGGAVAVTKPFGEDWASNVSLVFYGCNFTGNIAQDFGGAAYFSDANFLTISGSIFMANQMRWMDNQIVGKGAGVFLTSSYGSQLSTVTTVNVSTFVYNAALAGGGIWSMKAGLLNISGCMFDSNTAERHESANTAFEYMNGGGLYSEHAESLLIQDCTFVRNRAANAGGGVWSSNTARQTVVTCMFAHNEARALYRPVLGNKHRLTGGQHMFTGSTFRLMGFHSNFNSTTAESSMIVIENANTEFEQCRIESSEQGGTLLTAYGLPFKLTKSWIRFDLGAQMRLEVAAVRMFLSDFIGNGSIEFGTGGKLRGLDEAELGANRFEGVQLHLGDISKSNVQLRNNNGTNYFMVLQGTPKQCDDAGTGYNVCMSCVHACTTFVGSVC